MCLIGASRTSGRAATKDRVYTKRVVFKPEDWAAVAGRSALPKGITPGSSAAWN